MSTENPTPLTVEAAQNILERFTCLEMQSLETSTDREVVRQAIALVARASDYQILGVCADSVVEGFAALESYLTALGYAAPIALATDASRTGSVYIKFNTLKDSYYIDAYLGTYRGVLVSCQSSQESGINGTYGHFPLNLFAN